MPSGILDRPSYLDYLWMSRRSLEELQRDVDGGKIPRVTSCPRGTLLRIRTALQARGTDLEEHIRRDLRPTPPIGRVLGDMSPQPVAPPSLVEATPLRRSTKRP